jgi:uncharacterized protein (DUF58 family)
MRSLFAGFTTRGRTFLAAGAVVAGIGIGTQQRGLLSVGALLILLPLMSGLAAGRARYRLRCSRQLAPPRVVAGQVTNVTVQLENVSRLPTGLLLAEDTVPYSLNARPRFVLDRIEQGGSRLLSYPLRPAARGRYAIGPFRVRIADVFGLVELRRSFAAKSVLVVTPEVIPLASAAPPGIWLGDGDARSQATAAAAGSDDVVPRAYRTGDELRRVHWRSTARYGELMVRREEQHWRNRAVLFLDTRGGAHVGRGPESSFEFTVSAAASIGVRLVGEGIGGQFVTDDGSVEAPGRFEDALLDTLAVIEPSRNTELDRGLGSLAGASGLLIAIVGRLTADRARRLAAARPIGGLAIALLLDVPTWAAGQPAGRPAGETPEANGILTAAGWRVTTVNSATSLAAAWQRVSDPGSAGLAVPPQATRQWWAGGDAQAAGANGGPATPGPLSAARAAAPRARPRKPPARGAGG